MCVVWHCLLLLWAAATVITEYFAKPSESDLVNQAHLITRESHCIKRQ